MRNCDADISLEPSGKDKDASSLAQTNAGSSYGQPQYWEDKSSSMSNLSNDDPNDPPRDPSAVWNQQPNEYAPASQGNQNASSGLNNGGYPIQPSDLGPHVGGQQIQTRLFDNSEPYNSVSARNARQPLPDFFRQDVAKYRSVMESNKQSDNMSSSADYRLHWLSEPDGKLSIHHISHSRLWWHE